MADVTGYTWVPWEFLNEFALMSVGIILTCIVITPFFLGVYWLIKRLLK